MSEDDCQSPSDASPGSCPGWRSPSTCSHQTRRPRLPRAVRLRDLDLVFALLNVFALNQWLHYRARGGW